MVSSSIRNARVWFITGQFPNVLSIPAPAQLASKSGASAGMGLTLTRNILARGDYVIATARSLNSFDELRQDTKIDGERLRFLALDVTSPMAEIQQCLDEALGIWGRIDVLVNNAGTITYGAGEELG